MKKTIIASIVAAATAVCLGNAPPAWAKGAVVIIQRGTSDCGVDSGDIPGVPGFAMTNATITIAPSGALNVTCTGHLPAGVSLASTYTATVTCVDSPTRTTPGRIVATVSGEVLVGCHVPPQR